MIWSTYYEKLEESHIPDLSPLMKAAFDADTRLHTDLEADGPTGYDNGELLRKLWKMEGAETKVIYANGIMAGGYTIIKDKDIYTLDMLFIDPSVSSKGLGSKVWKDIESTYHEAKMWMLETPDYSTRNHHFYEKCGFKKMGEHSFEDGSRSFVFIKHMKRIV